MSSNDTGALALAAAANAAGLVVVVAMWRRHRHRRRALRSRHPSARPPLQVELVDVDRSRRIRLTVPAGAPELAIDIVSFRHREPPSEWASEPLVEPLVIAPGDEAVLESVLGPGAAAVDVVVAWTARRDTGAATGSQLFRMPPEPDPPTLPRPTAGFGGRATVALILITLGAGLLVGRSVADRDDDHDSRDAGSAPSSSAPTPSVSPPTTGAPTDPTTATTDASTTAPTGGTATTTVGSTSSAGTTAPATVGTTSSAGTTAPTAASATDPPDSVPREPAVQAEGRIAPCQFGDDCLVVDFTIIGFDGRTTEYVCEFADGSRFTFRFDSDGVVDACATGSPDETITVEVGGVRSDTVTRGDATSPSTSP